MWHRLCHSRWLLHNSRRVLEFRKRRRYRTRQRVLGSIQQCAADRPWRRRDEGPGIRRFWSLLPPERRRMRLPQWSALVPSAGKPVRLAALQWTHHTLSLLPLIRKQVNIIEHLRVLLQGRWLEAGPSMALLLADATASVRAVTAHWPHLVLLWLLWCR